MTDMIERVARVLRDSIFAPCERERCTCDDEFKCRTGVTADGMARAVIEAIREPTEEMVRAADLNAGLPYTSVYQHMIDAALSPDGMVTREVGTSS